MSRHLKNDNALEFLNQGVSRRLRMLKGTVDQISAIYWDDRIDPTDEDENATLSESINFFYANVYAILDCLAFVFAYEDPGYKLERSQKSELKKVGLFRPAFYKRIEGLEATLRLRQARSWYNEIVDLRHPVAHRIPLYFPDIHKEDDGRRIDEMEQEHWTSFNALLTDKTLPPENLANSLEKLSAELERKERMLKVFSGCFLHSFEESSKLYHLSRLTVDLGILYHLLDSAFDLLASRGSVKR